MTDTVVADEGVIKFHLGFTRAAPLASASLRALIQWRDRLWRLGLIGEDPARYGGAGFGNVSQRLLRVGSGEAFVISGTQTGAFRSIEARHFAVVTACYPARNRVASSGPIAPSSESLTHGMLYRLHPTVRFVFHVHSPEIWRAASTLGLPRTANEVAYGTPAMAAEVQRLWRTGRLASSRLLVMGGHEDGVIAFGASATQAGRALVRALTAARTRLRA